MSDADINHYRAVRARAVQIGDDETAERAAGELRAANLEKAIRRIVDAAPPLTETQRARLAALLLPAHRPDRVEVDAA